MAADATGSCCVSTLMRLAGLRTGSGDAKASRRMSSITPEPLPLLMHSTRHTAMHRSRSNRSRRRASSTIGSSIRTPRRCRASRILSTTSCIRQHRCRDAAARRGRLRCGANHVGEQVEGCCSSTTARTNGVAAEAALAAALARRREPQHGHRGIEPHVIATRDAAVGCALWHTHHAARNTRDG